MFVQNLRELKNWSDRDVEGVCALVAALRGVTPDVLKHYTKSIRDNNISGLVLQNCDIEVSNNTLHQYMGCLEKDMQSLC